VGFVLQAVGPVTRAAAKAAARVVDLVVRARVP
jgi:hypothetical protein